MRLLYVHSYCSLVWNHVASYRLRRYGTAAVVEGDLVYEKSDRPGDGAPVSVCSTAEDTAGSVDGGCEAVRSIGQSEGGGRVKVVDGQDIQQERYTLRDVLLPLPGYNAQYPSNDVGLR